MSSISIIGLGNRVPPARQGQRRRLRRALAALPLPVFLVVGYTGATWRHPCGPARRRPAGTRETCYPQVRNDAITDIPEPI
ncbi:MAG TPA: hypothetical protein VMF87_05640 [Streptosporangiaceae bacterium]|nr:hypothetical protein [Streptosporangiaceae bacterium]